MPVMACGIAAAFRQRIPGASVGKVHRLLYYAQGHHLATFGRPLFSEAVTAADAGPEVDHRGETVPEPGAELGEVELNTVGYVCSRYGRLSGRDLENLTRGETPWQRADASRRAGGSATIRTEWIIEYFRDLNAADLDEEDIKLDPEQIAQMLAGAARRREEPLRPDDLEKLRGRLQAAGHGEGPTSGGLYDRLAAEPGGLRELASARLRHRVLVLLREALERSEMSQADLAARLRKRRSAVNRVFLGDGNVSIDTLAEYLHELGFELDVNLVPAGEHRRAFEERRSTVDP